MFRGLTESMNYILPAVVLATLLGCSVAVNPLGRFGSFIQPCSYDTTYDFMEVRIAVVTYTF